MHEAHCDFVSEHRMERRVTSHSQFL
jgi:hypothetical protein